MAIYNKFNRGEVDPLALSRDDVTKINNSCETMLNFLPLRLGPMQYRPGSESLGTVVGEAYMVEFVSAIDDIAILQFTNDQLRIWIDDEILARTAVGSTITNPNFTTDLSGWTDNSGAGSSTAWEFGSYAALKGSGTTSAVLFQTVTLAGPDVGLEHGLSIDIFQGNVTVKIGTSGVSSDEIFSGVLGPGTHSLVFSPASNFTITLSSSVEYTVRVDSVDIEAAGEVILNTRVGITELSTIRYTQSADVIFIAFDSGQQFKVERRGIKSWSVVDYFTNDGPFGSINISEITLASSAISGDTTITASSAYFKLAHVGGLFKLGSAGQLVTATVTAQDTGTNSIRVTGVAESRQFTLTVTSLTGTGSTVTLQRSTDDATWVDVEDYTIDQSKTFDDELDNSILFYRLHVKTGDYVAGTIVLTLDFPGGSIEGICRVTGFISSTSVAASILKAFGSTLATNNWFEGQWSDVEGYPTSTKLYEGRLWHAGKSNLWGSVSDSFQSFDRDIEGDSKSIFRTIGFGPIDTVQWLGESTRLIMGITTDEISVRSSSFGEILTQNNINLKSGSSQGSAPIDAIRIDDLLYYVQRSGVKIMELEYALGSDNHKGRDLMTLHQNICIEGIKRIAVSRQPETRIIIVLDDGTVRVYLFDPAEEVSAWSRLTIKDGLVEDVVITPGLKEDVIHFVVNRSGTRYFEKLARLSDYVDKHFDAFKAYTSPGITITGLSHLEGSTVGVWADGFDRGKFVVSGGSITVTTSYTNVVVGLPYVADYLSNKLGQYIPSGSTGKASRLTNRSRIIELGLIAKDLHPNVFTYGPSFDLLDPLPKYEEDDDLNQYDNTPFEFNGTHDTDSRVAMRATGPVTILAMVFNVRDS
jgi:hypothetical protein